REHEQVGIEKNRALHGAMGRSDEGDHAAETGGTYCLFHLAPVPRFVRPCNLQMPALRSYPRPCLDQRRQAFHWVDAAQKERPSPSTHPVAVHDRGVRAALRHLHSIRDHADGHTEPEALHVLGFRLGGRVMATRPFQVTTLIEPPGDALFSVLVPHGPRLEHTPGAYDARDVAPGREVAKAVIVRQP